MRSGTIVGWEDLIYNRCYNSPQMCLVGLRLCAGHSSSSTLHWSNRVVMELALYTGRWEARCPRSNTSRPDPLCADKWQSQPGPPRGCGLAGVQAEIAGLVLCGVTDSGHLTGYLCQEAAFQALEHEASEYSCSYPQRTRQHQFWSNPEVKLLH